MHHDTELVDAFISFRHQPNAIAIGIDRLPWLLLALSGDDQFAVSARSRLRQGVRMMVDLYNRALLVMPILLLSTAHRQHMIETKDDILLPEPQHGFQVVGRKPHVDYAFRQLHVSTAIRTMCPTTVPRGPRASTPRPRLGPGA